MTVDEMKDHKRELGYTYEKIAELSGLPVGTVQKVLGGITKCPRYDTLKALERVFEPKKDFIIRESQTEYHVKKQQGDYTIEDYFLIPEERRAELIDGVFYDMASPTDIHQMISFEICARFREFINKNKGACIPAMAPLDVQLDEDNKTMVQPDILIVCDRSKFKNSRIFGAPDLIVEILSPSTRKRDTFLKTGKYACAGVKEYWIVDPIKKRVIVYDFEHEDVPKVYTFEEKVPVNIFAGECEIDFTEIYEYVRFLYEED